MVAVGEAVASNAGDDFDQGAIGPIERQLAFDTRRARILKDDWALNMIWENGCMAAHKLTETEIEQALAKMSGWAVKDGKLHREYKFADFAYAIGFIATAALGIEKMNHHPEWFNVYNRVTVDLTTHDSGGITQKDVELAQMLETIAGKLT